MLKRITISLFIVLSLCGCNSTNDSTENSVKSVQTGYCIILDGYEFMIDKNLQVSSGENVIYFGSEGKFNAKLTVVNRSYKEYSSDLSILQNNVEENGFLLEEPSLISARGREYVFARFILNGVENVIMVSEGNHDDCIVLQASVESEMSNEEIYDAVCTVVTPVRYVTSDDTTLEEIMIQKDKLSQGQNKKSGTLTLGDVTVKFSCPTDANSLDNSKFETCVTESFQQEQGSVYTTVMLYEPIGDEPTTAKAYVESVIEEHKSLDREILLESITYNDRVFYYYRLITENSDGTLNYDIEMVTEIEDVMYRISSNKVSTTGNLNVEILDEFLDIQVS